MNTAIKSMAFYSYQPFVTNAYNTPSNDGANKLAIAGWRKEHGTDGRRK